MPGESFEVELTQGAEDDLTAIHGYMVCNRSVDDADELLDEFIACVETLERFPQRGSVPKELDALGIREFRQILLRHFRVIYRINGSKVFVMIIADGRRDMQTLLERRLLGQ
ncbi:type II toxin-antitoxin system RelE/ParE family toxin [Sphingomonas lycopersici]|uniref:Type II toxin-antitoxin system RelE/ParE family toxin n=1 Tax=Sphingomonas lycopersici TaxID=2951807 RepID=A0AA42CSX5_9SPHN|nr:type II toxin-antitoxin system RelE/ParE family toxin [Sphingomonas lycopersici]MCW6537752.1 type II toxin-antitoxin system RelE/ParE family toxin [Sphingomonas lycopersici]